MTRAAPPGDVRPAIHALPAGTVPGESTGTKGPPVFHEHRELITQLKNDDHHFRRLFDEHNELDERITRLDERIELASDQEIEELKKRKLHLKDELYGIIRRHLA